MKELLNTLYVQTQGAYLRLDHDTLKLEVERATNFQVPLHHLGSIVVFGNVLVSPFLVHRCAEDGRSLVWLSEYGRFQARISGGTTGNVLLRRSQHAAADSEVTSLSIARNILAGKLQNARAVLMRSAREADSDADREKLYNAAQVHRKAITEAATATDLNNLRGIEGNAAKAYFGSYSYMVRTNRQAFAISERSRRPPRDPSNALLSFVYTLLAGECVAACEGVGLDPQIGFLHTLRPGRPSLALDLMEELRAAFADRLVLTLINRSQIQPDDFMERPGGAFHLKDSSRKELLVAYQKRKQEEIAHPIVKAKVPIGLIPHLQARLLARYLRGDTESYQPFVLQ